MTQTRAVSSSSSLAGKVLHRYIVRRLKLRSTAAPASPLAEARSLWRKHFGGFALLSRFTSFPLHDCFLLNHSRTCTACRSQAKVTEPSLHTAFHFPCCPMDSILKQQPITNNLDSLFLRKNRTWSNNMRPEYPKMVRSSDISCRCLIWFNFGSGRGGCRVRSTGICGYVSKSDMADEEQLIHPIHSDVHLWHTGRIGSMTLEDKLALGHESAGEVSCSVASLIDPISTIPSFPRSLPCIQR